MNILKLVTTPGSSHFQEQVRALRNNGVNCDIMSTSPADNDSQSPLNILPKQIRNTYKGVTFYKNIFQTNFTKEYDVIHATSGRIAPFALLQPKRPVVLTYWGTDLLEKRWGGYNRPLLRFYSKHADATIVRNEEMKNILNQGAYVIPNGIDMEKFSPMSQNNALKKVDWNPEQKHVLFPYNPHRSVKQYPLAKEVIEEVNKQIDNKVNLHVVSGEPHSKIPVYMNAADTLLLTSKHEGSPNTVKEAMACNCPIISTNVGDVKERLKEVSQSYICEDKSELVEKLIKVLSTNERSNGRRQIQDLNLENIANQYINVYKTVCKTSNDTV